jgi:hypothetical protein
VTVRRRPRGSALARLAPLALALTSGCGTLGAAAMQAAGTLALSQASPLAPLAGPADRYGPRDQQPGEVALREVAFRRGRVTVLADLSAPERRALRRARLAPAAAPPCRAGWQAEVVWLDRQRRWDRPLGWSGDHQLELQFDVPRALLREPLALDLLVAGGGGKDGPPDRCLRQPLGHPTVPLRRIERNSGGGGLGLLVASGPGPGDGFGPLAIQGSGSLGAWFGRWRVGGRLDACLGNCDPRSLLSFPIAAMVERLLYTGARLTVAAAVGYQPGRIDDLVSLWRGPRTWVHGPRVGLLLLGPRPFAGADPGEGYASRGVGLFVARLARSVYPDLLDGRTTPRRQTGVGTPSAAARAYWLLGLEATAL